jgi:hypothetical protein
MTGLRHTANFAFSPRCFLGFWLPVLAHSEEAEPKSVANATHFDTEHIFGFAEGSGTGAKGEMSIAIGSFAALGAYANIDNETSLRYIP